MSWFHYVLACALLQPLKDNHGKKIPVHSSVTIKAMDPAGLPCGPLQHVTGEDMDVINKRAVDLSIGAQIEYWPLTGIMLAEPARGGRKADAVCKAWCQQLMGQVPAAGQAAAGKRTCTVVTAVGSGSHG
jgi:hypothetical protein